MISTLRQLAGVAEVVKGAGLKIRSHMGSWVRIPPPAPRFYTVFYTQKTISKITGFRKITSLLAQYILQYFQSSLTNRTIIKSSA